MPQDLNERGNFQSQLNKIKTELNASAGNTADFEARITQLEEDYTALEARVTALEA